MKYETNCSNFPEGDGHANVTSQSRIESRCRHSQEGVQPGAVEFVSAGAVAPAARLDLSKELRLRRCDLLLTNAYSILKHGINDLYI